jgi:hypothetical protein
MSNLIDKKIILTLEEKMGHLPQEIFDIYESFEWIDIAVDIAHDLHHESNEIEDIVISIGLVLAGEIEPDELPVVLVESFSDVETEEIVRSATERIFTPIQELIFEVLEENDIQPENSWLIPQKSAKLLFRDAEDIEKPLSEEEKQTHVGLEFESYSGDTPDFFSAIADYKGNGAGAEIAQRREQRRAIEREAQRAFGKDLELAERNLRQELIQVEKNAPKGIQNIKLLEDELAELENSSKIQAINNEIQAIKQERIENAHDDAVDHEALQKEQKRLIAELQRTQAIVDNQKKALLDQLERIKEYGYIIEEKKLVLKKLLDYKAKIESLI